jgi:adenosylcobinamide-GDP ribazoletransferase
MWLEPRDMDNTAAPPTNEPEAPGASAGERSATRQVIGDQPGSPDRTHRWPPPLRGVRAAFVSFSRLPFNGFPYRTSEWQWAPAHLPLVGAAVGGLSAGVFLAAGALGLGPLLRASLALALSIWLTGALHEDGLADSADGLGAAHGDRERALAIMKDSRIGTYGAVALIVSLLWRTAALAELAASAWFAIVYVHVWARIVPVLLLGTQPYIDRPDAKSRGLFATRPRHVLVALAWGGSAAALGTGLGVLPGSTAVAAALIPLAITPLLAHYFHRCIGGVTGDLLGAAEQLAELGAWVAVSATLAR